MLNKSSALSEASTPRREVIASHLETYLDFLFAEKVETRIVRICSLSFILLGRLKVYVRAVTVEGFP